MMILLLGLIIGSNQLLASNWQFYQGRDEFGDIDGSSGFYMLRMQSQLDPEDAVVFYYSTTYGVFIIDLWPLSHVQSIRVKSKTGQIYNLEFEAIGPSSTSYGILFDSSQILVDLLDQGNFSMSVKTPGTLKGDPQNNFMYKFGTEGRGIRSIAGSDMDDKPEETTLKGKIGGKYEFTMVIDQPVGALDVGGYITGIYWYGTGKNGKMTIRGYMDRNGRMRLEEYDPSGKKCGNWQVNCAFNNTRRRMEMTGVMTNAKGQTFKVAASE
ncbi:MAG: hypothetical protein K2G53_10465 [Muribaculaceae bacterium]|nr:hypothetical protein [Muribaculaceae bacterium]